MDARIGSRLGAIYNTGTIVGYRVTFDENHAGESGAIDIVLGGFGGAIFIFVPGTIVLERELPDITEGVHILGHEAGGTTITS